MVENQGKELEVDFIGENEFIDRLLNECWDSKSALGDWYRSQCDVLVVRLPIERSTRRVCEC